MPCSNKLKRGAQDKLRRIAKHKHPHTKACLGPIWRVTNLPEVTPVPATAVRVGGVPGAFDSAEGGDDGFDEWVRERAEDEDHDYSVTRASVEGVDGGNCYL